jgi:hypothetical protein
MGSLDNTLFFYIVGDNGASAEGGPEGTYNEMMALNGIVGKADQMMEHIDEWGGPQHLSALRHRLGLGERHTFFSGPNKSPATSAVRATAW